MAPVEKRLTISLTGSTSSIGTGGAVAVREPEQAAQGGQAAWPGRRPGAVYSLKTS